MVASSATRICGYKSTFTMISPVHVLPRWFPIVAGAAVPILISLMFSVEFSIARIFQFVIAAIAMLVMVRLMIDWFFLNEKEQANRDQAVSKRFDKMDTKIDESKDEIKKEIKQTYGAMVSIMHQLHGKSQPISELRASGTTGPVRGSAVLTVTPQPKRKRRWYQRSYTNVEGAVMRFLGWA